MNNESVEIVELRKKIEESVGRVMHTPADFDFLSGAVWERIREYISPTTLKRTWGYLDGVKNIRFSTLETLARFAGFKSWDNYLAERRFAQEQNSAIVSEGVIEAARLAEGDVVEVEWKPDMLLSIDCNDSQRIEKVSELFRPLVEKVTKSKFRNSEKVTKPTGGKVVAR